MSALARKRTFAGAGYEPALDEARLLKQIDRVQRALERGGWMTLRHLARMADAPEGSASAQIRNLRKEEFGAHVIERKRVADRTSGLWLYRWVK